MIAKRTVGIVGLSLALVAGWGCTSDHPFRLGVTVQDASTGVPLEGVQVVLDTTGAAGAAADFGVNVGLTKSNGRIEYDFQRNDEHMPTPARRWYIKAIKEGYAPEQIDVSPPEWPKGTTQIWPINILISLKPLPPKKS